MFADKEGRYVAVEAECQKKKILIINIYAPNGAKREFFEKLNKEIHKFDYEHIIVAGDFNGTVNNDLDRSSAPSKKIGKVNTGKLPRSLYKLIENLELQDVWRRRNKKVKDYTYYSCCHGTWSRLDMIWAMKEIELETHKIEIVTASISDHSPICWTWKNENKRQKRWIINEDLLEQEENLNSLKKEIKEYFDFNLNTVLEVKMPVVWDAFKSVLRGRLISMNAAHKKKKKKQGIQISNEIWKKELELKRKPGSKKLEKQLKILKQQKNSLENKEIVWNLNKTNQKFFEGADKIGRLLANQFKKRKEKSWINKVSVEGKEINTKNEIKKEFKIFYLNLFKSK